MPSGRVKAFFADKGFGFIGPDDGSKDVFCHAKQFPGGTATGVTEGSRVIYEAEFDEKRGKMQARSWSLEAGGAAGGQPNYSAMAQQSFGGGDRSSPYGGAANALPPGWETANDPTSGKPYYFNRATNETRWDPPQLAPVQAPVPQPMATPQLPQGWESAQDPGSGKTYYFNRATNETRWDPPLGMPAGAPMNPMGGLPGGVAGAPNGFSQPNVATMPAVAPTPLASSGQLPPGWESAVDPGSQKTYYFNRATNETKWEFPSA